MVGYLSGYWFGSVCDCKCNDWEDLTMAKKTKKASEILEYAMKIDKGFYPLAKMDYSKYPEIKKFVDDFNKAHPHLAVEVMNDTDKYMDKLMIAENDLTEKMLERTNQFKEYYEVSCMYHGIITFFMTLSEMFSERMKDLQEKLNRYENND